MNVWKYSKEPEEKETVEKEMPVVKFKDNEQLNAYLKEWQSKLQLTDWLITASLTEGKCYIGKEECSGKNIYQVENRLSAITISNYWDEDFMTKQYQELVLVHELLHLIIPIENHNEETLETIMYDRTMHGIIERMAKALIMAKYDMKLEDFLA
jgi:hypothetical protein